MPIHCHCTCNNENIEIIKRAHNEKQNIIPAVSQDANETTRMPMGLRASLLDTADFANPKLSHNLTLQKNHTMKSKECSTKSEHFILAVGQDANETTRISMGSRASFLDTVDFANPKLGRDCILQQHA